MTQIDRIRAQLLPNESIFDSFHCQMYRKFRDTVVLGLVTSDLVRKISLFNQFFY